MLDIGVARRMAKPSSDAGRRTPSIIYREVVGKAVEPSCYPSREYRWSNVVVMVGEQLLLREVEMLSGLGKRGAKTNCKLGL
jgi:hypothetical protein